MRGIGHDLGWPWSGSWPKVVGPGLAHGQLDVSDGAGLAPPEKEKGRLRGMGRRSGGDVVLREMEVVWCGDGEFRSDNIEEDRGGEGGDCCGGI